MSKKKGMFSWLGFGQDKKEQAQKSDVVEEQALEQDKQQPSVAAIGTENIAAKDTGTGNTDAENSEVVSVETTLAPKDDNASELLSSKPEASKPELAEVAESEALESPTLEMSESEETLLSEASEISKLEESEGAVSEPIKVEQPEVKLGFFARLKQSLSKTRQNLGGGLFDLFRGKKIDDELFEELETHLLLADVGVETTTKIIDSLIETASRSQLKDAEALYDLLKVELKKVIVDVSKPLEIPESDGPFVMLMVGVNGVGKTTTIGKLAKQFQAQGKSVMLAAGDTFRAAAVEQLQVWGERNNIPVIAQQTGADSASVIFDAISAAKARKVDILIADTAGRLQNKSHLMEELKKVVRVMKKLDVNAPHEVMLTLDAGTGQNALSQTKLFNEAVGLTGLTLTKLDGTAKGGVVFAVADKHNIPIRYLGVGEGIDDLRPFNSDDFIEALFDKQAS